MKQFAIGLVLVALLGGLGQASAQEDNLIGLYFDPFGDLDCIEAATLDPFSFVDLYVILQNPTFEELWAFEFGLEVEGPVLMTGWDFPHGFPGFNFGEGGQYIADLENHLPMEETNILMIFSLLYLSTTSEEVCFTLSGSEPSSLDPLYPTLAYSGQEMVSGYVNNGIEGACTARISETICNIVATDSHTWDSLKTLYR